MSLECAPNFRDLGGGFISAGCRLRPGRIYRSEVIRKPRGDDAEKLADCGIGLVLDLRSAHEVAATPNTYWHTNSVEVIDFNVGDDIRAKGSYWQSLVADSSPDAVRSLIHGIYRHLPLAVVPALRLIFERLEAGGPPMLMHCTAGKDRTGVTSALLLHALGASREFVIEDYLETRKRLTDRKITQAGRLMFEALGRSIEPDSLNLLVGVEPDFIAQSLGWIDRKYGNTDLFLRQEAGLDDARRAVLRNRLVEAV